MTTREIKVEDAVGVATVGMSAVLVKAEGAVTNPPAPPPPALSLRLLSDRPLRPPLPAWASQSTERGRQQR